MLSERGVAVDHTTVYHWVRHYAPLLCGQCRRRQRRLNRRWRMDETYVEVGGRWCYLYRAVDRHGKTIDFLLSPRRDELTAYQFLKKAILSHGSPEIITPDGYAANRAAIERINAERKRLGIGSIAIRTNRYLNNLVEQDHRAVKRRIRRMLGLKSFASAAATVRGIEMVHMIRKGQLKPRYDRLSFAQQFEALAA